MFLFFLTCMILRVETAVAAGTDVGARDYEGQPHCGAAHGPIPPLLAPEGPIGLTVRGKWLLTALQVLQEESERVITPKTQSCFRYASAD